MISNGIHFSWCVLVTPIKKTLKKDCFTIKIFPIKFLEFFGIKNLSPETNLCNQNLISQIKHGTNKFGTLNNPRHPNPKYPEQTLAPKVSVPGTTLITQNLRIRKRLNHLGKKQIRNCF